MMKELIFKTALPMEQIERNFEGVDLYDEIMAGLEEALAVRKAEKAADPFFCESNMAFLRRGKAAIEAGEGAEHDIIEVDE